MDDLDYKLKQILLYFEEDGSLPLSIYQIKQLFADAGYLKHPRVSCISPETATRMIAEVRAESGINVSQKSTKESLLVRVMHQLIMLLAQLNVQQG